MSTLEFYDHSLEDLTQYFISRGEKPFRAEQMFKWVYGRGETSLDQMTDLSKNFREQMKSHITFTRPSLVKRLDSVDGTMKFLFSVEGGDKPNEVGLMNKTGSSYESDKSCQAHKLDKPHKGHPLDKPHKTHETIESVLIPSGDRLTLCVSSEIGCNMACKFCFTGKKKMKRKLQVHEIVGQYLVASQSLSQGQRITNIVFMGMGEPLDNPEAVFKSIEILHSSWGANLSRKKITVSTAGVVPMIPKVTESGVRLAVSLNAVDDKTRSQIMPLNNKWPMAQLLDACRKHVQQARDLVTLEYVLLRGVNDSLEDAKKLCTLTQDVPSKINIIPFNEHPDSGFYRPSEDQVDRFQQCLMDRGVHVLRRKTMGREIFAACGQLTSAYAGHPQSMSLSSVQ